MQHSSPLSNHRFVEVLLAAIALVTPVAHAQMHFGSPNRIVLGPKAVTLQAGRTGQKPSTPQIDMTLVGPGPIGAATTTNLFAQVAIGGGYTTVFTFLNTGSDPATGSLILTADDGTPLNATLASPGPGGGVVGSSTPINVLPGGTQFVTASAVSPADSTKAGWARVESSGGSLGGVATFQVISGSALTTIVGVLSAPATSSATIPVDDDGTLGAQSRFTGYAVANPGNTDINIKIDLVNPDGSLSQAITPTVLNPLRPGSHIARFLWQDLTPNLQFRGSMVLIEQAGQQFSVVALVQNQGLFTAIPVIPAKAPNVP
jgi:hypothetical protein